MKLNNGFTTFPESEEAYVDSLKDVMEKPFHAMRVAIQYALGTVAPEGDGVFNDTKDELIRLYSGLGFDGDLMRDIVKLRKVGGEYVELLEARQNGDLSRSEFEGTYAEMLNRMIGCYPEAFHFVEQNAKMMVD